MIFFPCIKYARIVKEEEAQLLPGLFLGVSKKFSYSFLKLRCQVFTYLIDVILKRAVLKTKIELHSALIFFNCFYSIHTNVYINKLNSDLTQY